MNKTLGDLIESINKEIRESGAADMHIKRALINFAKAYNTSPHGDAAKVGEDTAALEFLDAVFGANNPAIRVYIDFYDAAKKGEASIE